MITAQPVPESRIIEPLCAASKGFARWYRRRRSLVRNPIMFNINATFDESTGQSFQVRADYPQPEGVNLPIGAHVIMLRSDGLNPETVAHEIEHCIMADTGWPHLRNTLGLGIHVPATDPVQASVNVVELFRNYILDLEIDRQLTAFQLASGRDVSGWRTEFLKVTDENTVQNLVFDLIKRHGCKNPQSTRQCFRALIERMDCGGFYVLE